MARKDQKPEPTEPKITNHILPVPITKEMQKAYLDYAMSVIVDRALPEVGDGLKPSQRRILLAMHDLGLNSSAKYRKCAKIAGDTSGNYHPHGEQVVYPTLVRMAQNFNMRYCIIDGQGNFGSIDGDPPAAMRYTEARMSKFGDLLMQDIDKATVTFRPTYDGTREEPVILPSLFPNLICNGATGIAVGMATNIPTHNLGEVIDALISMINTIQIVDPTQKTLDSTLVGDSRYPTKLHEVSLTEFTIDSDATVEDLMKHIKGPDFPTGAEIFDTDEITQAYATGRGRILTRAVVEMEEVKGGYTQIIVREIPYQVNKAVLVARIAELVKDEKITKIRDLRDESDRDGMRIVIELKREARAQNVLNLLYKYTEMEKTFNANIVALVDGEPRTLTLKMMLQEYLRHRKKIIINRTVYLLIKARERAHILEGLKKALDHIDEIIAVIKKSKDQETAKLNLIQQFKFTEIQAMAILDMQLRRLAALEREKIENELADVTSNINSLEALLKDPQKTMDKMKEEFVEIKGKFADSRRTKVTAQRPGEINEEELIESQDIIITMTRSGYIKRLPEDAYKRQGRGGKGVIGTQLREEDVVDEIVSANTRDTLLLFTNKGKVYNLKVIDVPEASRTAKGTAVVNLVNLESGERVTSVLNLNHPEGTEKPQFLLMATINGTIKRVAIEEFLSIRRSGIIAIELSKGDELSWIKTTDGKSQVILVSTKGKAIRFNETDSRPMGRAAAGVRGISLGNDDRIIGMEIITGGDHKVLTASAKGFGKLTPISEYPIHRRGGSGIFTAKITEKTGNLVGMRLIDGEECDVLMTSSNGQIIRLPSKDVSVLGRATQGVRLMKLDGSDLLAAMTCL